MLAHLNNLMHQQVLQLYLQLIYYRKSGLFAQANLHIAVDTSLVCRKINLEEAPTSENRNAEQSQFSPLFKFHKFVMISERFNKI